MEITNIRLKKVSNNEKILGVASIQLDNCLVIHDIKLIRTREGRLVVSFPNKKIKKYNIENGEYKTTWEYSDIVHPSNSEFRNYIESTLVEVYNKEEEFINE